MNQKPCSQSLERNLTGVTDKAKVPWTCRSPICWWQMEEGSLKVVQTTIKSWKQIRFYGNLILFKQDSLAWWTGLRRAVHSFWGSPPLSKGEALAVGVKATPCSCSKAECQKLALFVGAVTLGGARWVTPTVAATHWVPCLMQVTSCFPRKGEEVSRLSLKNERTTEGWKGSEAAVKGSPKLIIGLLVITLSTFLPRPFPGSLSHCIMTVQNNTSKARCFWHCPTTKGHFS